MIQDAEREERTSQGRPEGSGGHGGRRSLVLTVTSLLQRWRRLGSSSSPSQSSLSLSVSPTGQRASDALQPSKGLRRGHGGADEERKNAINPAHAASDWRVSRSTVGEGVCRETDLLVSSFLLRARRTTATRPAAVWPRDRGSSSWRTTWSSSARSTSRSVRQAPPTRPQNPSYLIHCQSKSATHLIRTRAPHTLTPRLFAKPRPH